MAYTVRELLLDKNPHNNKYKYGNPMTPTEITYHQTFNLSPAINERNYLNNRTDNVYVSFHWVVDEKEAIKCLPENVSAWHAGDGTNGDGNKKSISIEIARSTNSDIKLRDAAIDNGARLIASLMKKYNIGMDKVKSHNQRSGKNCPHDIRGRYGEAKFRNLIKSYYGALNGESEQQNKPSTNEVYRVRKNWSDASTQKGAYSDLNNAKKECDKHEGYFVFDSKGNIVYPSINTVPSDTSTAFKEYKVKIICDSLNVREKADFNSKVVTVVTKGQVFTIVGEDNGLLKLKSGVGYITSNTKYIKKV